VETQQRVLHWCLDYLTTSGQPKLGRLLRVEAMPARVWLAAAPDELYRVREETSAHLGLSAIEITNPCGVSSTPRPSTPSRSTRPTTAPPYTTPPHGPPFTRAT
jgi:hypothetical protein